MVTCKTPGQEYLQRGVLVLPPALPRPVQRRVVHEEVETAGLHVPPGLGQEPLVAAAQPRLAVHSKQTVIRTPVPAYGAGTQFVLLSAPASSVTSAESSKKLSSPTQPP